MKHHCNFVILGNCAKNNCVCLGTEEFAENCIDYEDSLLEMTEEVELALQAIGNVIQILFNKSPLDNTGDRFTSPIFSIGAYSWSDEDTSPNFSWRDFKCTWYKHLSRGGEQNREISNKELAEMLEECLQSIITLYKEEVK